MEGAGFAKSMGITGNSCNDDSWWNPFLGLFKLWLTLQFFRSLPSLLFSMFCEHIYDASVAGNVRLCVFVCLPLMFYSRPFGLALFHLLGSAGQVGGGRKRRGIMGGGRPKLEILGSFPFSPARRSVGGTEAAA